MSSAPRLPKPTMLAPRMYIGPTEQMSIWRSGGEMPSCSSCFHRQQQQHPEHLQTLHAKTHPLIPKSHTVAAATNTKPPARAIHQPHLRHSLRLAHSSRAHPAETPDPHLPPTTAATSETPPHTRKYANQSQHTQRLPLHNPKQVDSRSLSHNACSALVAEATHRPTDDKSSP